MAPRITRREAFRIAAGAAAAGGAWRVRSAIAGPAPAPAVVPPRWPMPRLPPVLVARDRVLRTVVGLRPFRPSGFVVRSEKLGDKVIVHNYGHGGAGVTLSWGTAKLAVDEVLRTRDRAAAVLGCGAVGLATARLLQQYGIKATIYTRDQPPATTSDIAGARWYPFDVFDRKAVTPQFLETLWNVSRFLYGVFRKMVGPEYGVRVCATYACRDTPFPKESLLNFDSPVHELLPGLRDLAPAEKPFPYAVVRRFETMLIEPAIYLPAVMRDHANAGGHIVTRNLATKADIAALPERTVVNCTGIGSAALFGDPELMPIKGQLTILRPQPEVDYITLPPDLYMFPRRDGIVLGGTFERGVSSMEPNREAEERILAGHARFFAVPGAPAPVETCAGAGGGRGAAAAPPFLRAYDDLTPGARRRVTVAWRAEGDAWEPADRLAMPLHHASRIEWERLEPFAAELERRRGERMVFTVTAIDSEVSAPPGGAAAASPARSVFRATYRVRVDAVCSAAPLPP